MRAVLNTIGVIDLAMEGRLMSSTETALALQRYEAALVRRPEFGPHDDSPAQVRLIDGTRVRATHANGTVVESDMPGELAGDDKLPTPGWYFRTGLASCAVTSIAMLAAVRGVELSRLEARVESRSDACGMFGLPNAQGRPAEPGPIEMRLGIAIDSPGADAAALRALVDTALERSPIPSLVRRAIRIELSVEAAQT